MKHLEKSEITNLGPAWQYLTIEIHRDETGTGISLALKTFITTSLKRFHMQDTDAVTTPMDPNLKHNLADDRGETEFDMDSAKSRVTSTIKRLSDR